MTAVLTTTDELATIVERAVAAGIARATMSTSETVGIDGLAARYGVTRRTISYWLKDPTKLPPRRAGQRWLLSDVTAWERDTGVPKKAQRTA